MEISIKIFSDKVLNGETCLDLQKILRQFLSFNIKVKEIFIYEKNQKTDDISSPTLFLIHDECIDEFVANHKVFYENETKFIESEGLLSGKDFPIIVIPIESDIEKILEVSLEIIKTKYNLSNIKIFRLFGKNVEDVKENLKSSNIENFAVYGENMLTDIYLDENESKGFVGENEVSINRIFESEIYADGKYSMAEVAAKLLKISNKKIYVSDGFTKGSIVSSLFSALSDIKIEGDIFEIDQQNDFVKKQSEDRCFTDEKELVYQLSINNVDSKKVDISLVVAGKKEGKGYRVFMAISKKNSVDVYQMFVEGEFFDTVCFVKDWVIFNLIKKLRQKDFENQ